MSRIDEIAAEARARGVKPWLAVKERLAEGVIAVLAKDERAVLQGGGALHFAYGSPRLSADVDFVGESVHDALAACGDEIASRAGELAGAPARWSMRTDGRLVRGKVTIEIDAARRIVLPVEAFEVPARQPVALRGGGRVEQAQEIAADKIVASADRLARRGALKTRDLYDLWFIKTRLGLDAPARDLVSAKAGDYGQPPRGADLAAAARAVTAEEMRASLEGVLPKADAEAIDPAGLVEAAAEWLGRYSDAL